MEKKAYFVEFLSA